MLTELLTEGGTAIVAGGFGAIMGWHRGRAERNIVKLFTTGQAENLWCQCGHAMSFHEKRSRMCFHRETPSAQQVTSMAVDEFNRWRRANSCRCQKFVGDPSKNPPPVETRKDLLDL